ncbi:calcofluor white hypersensitive protein [Moniliophthora roreri MCA 2997]|uniref:Calcofluor white hypersensitive protein n=1 Tax=Moniliophthora roreri (strain MCA 2997) TaxID=1381753 RepID=V2W7M8_MONRO|nr:calcofluor white hypersensitive protein [Moniliophthora roreri MCA 2997]
MTISATKEPTARRHSPQNLVIRASTVARAHTILAYAAFSTALVIGLFLHYKKIVKNGVAGFPQEWFPSVSATIGDWYPERNIFQILIALTSGPRFCLVALQYLLQRSSTSSLPTIIFICGLLRTFSCGGWVYITSTDDHDVHDVCMVAYVVLNLPWMIGGVLCTPLEYPSVRRKRKLVASAFFLSIIPLVYFFIQHKVHRIPGAYTHYSFFEWGLIIFDVLYDSFSEQEFREAGLEITIGSPAGGSLESQSVPANITEKLKRLENANLLEEKGQKAHARGEARSQPTPFSQILHSSRPYVGLACDMYLSYVFWSIFTSLIPTLFYFSVWELGIAGQELALLATLSPVFLGISSLRSWASTRRGSTILHLLSFSGLAAFVLQSPIHRLFVVTPAAAIAMIRQAVEWRKYPLYSSIMTAIGFMLSSLSKHANHSNNPLWPIVDHRSGGYNKTGLTLAVLTLLEFYTRPLSAQPPAEREKSKLSYQSTLTAALPLGSLLFIFHHNLSEPGTLVAWSWTGYENGHPRGPLPHFHGSLTLISQSLGVLLAIFLLQGNRVELLSHPLWFLVGNVGAFIMYQYRDWLGYMGGLLYALFAMSITPLVVVQASRSNSVGHTYFVAMVVYCLLSLAAVWTVAYAFVPGGVYLRERTDLVILAQLACLVPAFKWQKSQQHTLYPSLPTLVVSYTRTTLMFISLLSVLTTLYHLPSSLPSPYRPGPRILRAGIWTIHFGIDNEGRDSQRRVRDLIQGLQLDIIGLLETDLHRPVYGNRDLTRVIIEEGYYVDLGPGPNAHTWGAVLLSKFPIINSTHHLLPSPHGELAPAIEAVLDVFGTQVVVIVSHNGQEEDPLDRELQSRGLGQIMASHDPNPTIFLGYVVTKPHSNKPAPYKFLVEDGKMHDIDQFDYDRWCEYILYRGLYRTSYARVSRSTITDTELQVGQFVLPKYGYSVNDTWDARYIRVHKESLPKEHWFPMEYYGSEREGGVNGHFYHVFNTPLYYGIPEGTML